MQTRLLLLVALVPALSAQNTPGVAPDDAQPVFGTTVVVPGGLCGEIYDLPEGTEKLPDFEKLELTPVGAIYTNGLNVTPRAFTAGFPGITSRFEWFAIDFRGRFWVETPGVYRFTLTSDDGSKLYIDDKLVISLDGIHDSTFSKSRKVTLSGGIHRIRLPYFQGPRFEVALVLEIKPPNGKSKVFDTNEFKPPSNPKDWTFDPAPVLHSSANASPNDSQNRQKLSSKGVSREKKAVGRCPADW